MAATFLDPKPKNFLAATDLTRDVIEDAVRHGRAKTAMIGFANQISNDEINDVTSFIFNTFVQQQLINTFYHIPENGWPDHERQYKAAYPFALREIAIDTQWDQLNEIQRAGLRLFMSSCITCHDVGKVLEPGVNWDKYPLSSQGCGVVCHDGDVYFPGSTIPGQQTPHRTPYAIHEIKPNLSDLTDNEKIGEILYQDNCSFCHAADGTGKNWIGSFLEPHARNLTDRTVTAHLDRPALLRVIQNGLEGTSMPAWKNVLNESQIINIAAYIERAFFLPMRQE